MTAEEAERAALEHLANDDWEPAVTKVEDAGAEWRVFYNTRAYVETKAISHALAGNLPLLVDKASGDIRVDETYAADSPRWHSTSVARHDGGISGILCR